MTTRDGIAIDLDVAIGAAAEDNFTPREWEPLSHIRTGRIDQDQTRLAGFLGRFDDLDLGDAGLPLTHENGTLHAI